MLSEGSIQELSLLEPYGKGNSKPLFAEQHFALLEMRVMGKRKNVLKMKVRNKTGYVMDALYFGEIEKWDTYLREAYGNVLIDKLYRGQADPAHPVDMGLVYYPDINEYRGTRTIQIVIQHFCKIPEK
jgi:single-stranded-DNA-specific exonuclease